MPVNKKKIPNPGSSEALRKGCLCPVLDNYHGAGSGFVGFTGEPVFWTNAACKLHGKEIVSAITRRQTKNKTRKAKSKKALKRRL